jgi:hypothetical protein
LSKKREIFFEGFPGFRCGEITAIVRVRLAFVDLQDGLDAGLAQFAVKRAPYCSTAGRACHWSELSAESRACRHKPAKASGP